MRVLLGLLLIAGLGCTQTPTGPSREYERAVAALERALAETLDPSYGDPAFDEVEALFRAVPPAAADHAKALLLADEIAGGRAKQRALVEQLLASAKEPVVVTDGEEETEEEPPPEPPAAPTAPAAGPAAGPPAAPVAAPAAPAPSRRARATGPVVMYVTSWCGVCKRARQYLQEKSIPFEEHDLEREEGSRDELSAKAARAGIRVRGVPVIDIGGSLLQGFSAAGIEPILRAKGYL